MTEINSGPQKDPLYYLTSVYIHAFQRTAAFTESNDRS